jgi:hypothetical protein
MSKHSLPDLKRTFNCPPRHRPLHAPALIKHPSPPPIYRPSDYPEHSVICWKPPRKHLRKMPKSSSLSIAMRPKVGKENVNSPMTPLSPESPNATNGDTDAATATPHPDMSPSPASSKPRKDSKNIFSNFTANLSSSRLASPDTSDRQVSGREKHHGLYTNGSGSTPDLSRPVYTPNSDGKGTFFNAQAQTLKHADIRSDSVGPEQRNGTATSANASENGSVSNKQGAKLGRSTSTKNGEGRQKKLNKAQPPQLSPDATTWSQNGDTLKTAPLEKDKSWRGNMSFGKLRTHSADRQDGSQHSQRSNDENSSRKDKAEQSSVASGSHSESRGAHLISNLGFGAQKMGKKIESTRKGIFGKLGRSSSNHETLPLLPKEPYQFKIIHTPLVEQTRLTRISSRLENSKDKTEFWMPALPWRCIE